MLWAILTDFAYGIDSSQLWLKASVTDMILVFSSNSSSSLPVSRMPSSSKGITLKHRSLSLAYHLPGNNVGMMLHFGNHDLVAGQDEPSPKEKARPLMDPVVPL